MSIIVKVSKEVYVEDLKNTLLPKKLYVLPKDVYEAYVEKGVPLEYVDSLKLKVDKNFFNLKSQKLRVLFATFQALGDGLLLTPVLRRLKELNKDLYIVLETKKEFNLLKDCPYVDEFVYSPIELDYLKSFDTVINLHMLVGSIMFDLNHMAYYYFKLLGVEEENPNLIPYVYIDEELDKEIKNLFDEYRIIYKKPILGFHFSASSIHRMAPVNIFCNAIKDLEKFFTIVYSYPPQYKTYADEIPNYLPKAIDISSHIKSIEYLPPYVKNLDYLISIETVLPHIAAYTKTPTLVVLGPGKFENVYDYKVPYIKGLEMNYKGDVCSSPCQLHISLKCPEAVVKNTPLSPCFNNLNQSSLLKAFIELLEQINENKISKDLKNILNQEEKATEEVFKRLSTISFDIFSDLKLAFLGHSPILKEIFGYIFSKDYFLDKKIVLIAKGGEAIGASLFINKISIKKPIIYVEDEFYKKILHFLNIDAKILDYSNIYIPENALVIDICFSAFNKHEHKHHIEKILQHIKQDTIFFSFFLNDKRLHKYISKGQDIYTSPLDMFVVETNENIAKHFNLNLEKLPINPADYTNTFGEHSIFKEIHPHNQAYRLAQSNRDYAYILCLTNTDYKSHIEEATRFYSFYEKTFLKPDIDIKASYEEVEALFFSVKSPMNEYLKNYFENTLFIEISNTSRYGKNTIKKYIEEYTGISSLWFYGDVYLEYFKTDENFLKAIQFGPEINIILERNPFTNEDYLRALEDFISKYPKINIYTFDKGVYDILSKKYQNIYHFEIDYDGIEAFNVKQNTIDLLIVSESNILPVKNQDFVESFFARYIQNFSKSPQRIILDFIKEYSEKEQLYYFDKDFLDNYKDIINYSLSLDSFLAQEIKDIAYMFTKDIVYACLLNFQDIEHIKDVAKEHSEGSRYLPDIMLVSRNSYNELLPRAKAIVYLKPLTNFQEIPYFCLKASKSNIPCITQYQKSLENIPNIILAKNLMGLKEAVGLVLSAKTHH